MVFFAQKTPDFGPKNRLRIWGVPPSPLHGFFSSSKTGITDLGGTPTPPFTDKIRKVVFDPFPLRVVFSHWYPPKKLKCGKLCICRDLRVFYALYFHSLIIIEIDLPLQLGIIFRTGYNFAHICSRMLVYAVWSLLSLIFKCKISGPQIVVV